MRNYVHVDNIIKADIHFFFASASLKIIHQVCPLAVSLRYIQLN